MFLEPRLNKKMDSGVYCSSSKENRSLKLQGSRPPPELAEQNSMNNPPVFLIVEEGSKWALCKTGPSFSLGRASLTSTACMCHNPLQLPPLAGDTTTGARAEPKSLKKFGGNCPRSPAEFAERCLWNSPQSLWSLAWTQSTEGPSLVANCGHCSHLILMCITAISCSHCAVVECALFTKWGIGMHGSPCIFINNEWNDSIHHGCG